MYFPKSQITTNLFTNGGEFILSSTGENYKGDYWSTSDGNNYTGKNPKALNSELLILSSERVNSEDPLNSQPPDENLIISSLENPPFTNTETFNFQLLQNYLKLPISSTQISRLIPQVFFPQPTESDYQFKEFQRYFCKKNNELIYLEISSQTFLDLSSNSPKIAFEMYTPFQIPWTISGEEKEVFNINKKVVATFERNNRSLYGFSDYFKNNFTQFFKQEVNENLSTDGGEYITKDGREYIGDYHIHPEKGPMVGAIHIKTPHEYLYPIDTPFTGSLSTPLVSSTPSYSPPASSGGGGGY